MEKPVLSVNKISKRFGGLQALQEVSFEVHSGEIIGIMGPNGAGKSTLINIISGEYKPDSGSIKFQGHNITGCGPHKVCRLGIARTYQIPRPFDNLTAFGNVLVSAMYGAGLGKSDAEAEAIRALESTLLADKKDMHARHMLVLTLKRLELSRALASKPVLLLMDEVAAGLTENEIPEILDIIKNIHKTGITIILIEHVMKVMMEAVDRIIVMDGGRKIAEGIPEEIMRNQAVVEAYFG